MSANDSLVNMFCSPCPPGVPEDEWLTAYAIANAKSRNLCLSRGFFYTEKEGQLLGCCAVGAIALERESSRVACGLMYRIGELPHINGVDIATGSDGEAIVTGPGYLVGQAFADALVGDMNEIG